MRNLLFYSRAQAVQNLLVVCVSVSQFITSPTKQTIGLCLKTLFINPFYILFNHFIPQICLPFVGVTPSLLHIIHRPYKYYNEVYKGVLV